MSDVMLFGGDGGLEYRLGRFGLEISTIPLERAVAVGFDVGDVLDLTDPPALVVFGPELERDAMLGLAEAVDALSIVSAMIAVADPSPELVLDAMRAGVRDVIDARASDDDFREVLEWAKEHVLRRTVPASPASRQTDGRVVVVASPKGGVGKSTVAVNLAVDLARQAPSQVVIIDLDLRFGDVATLLDLAPDHSIADVFASRGGLDTLLLKTYLTSHVSGLWVLSAPDSPASADDIGAAQIHHVLQALAREFRYVVVDTGSGLDEHTLAAMEESTDAVFVSAMDVAGVRNLRKEVDLLATLEVLPTRSHLVVNLADKRSGLRSGDIATSVGMPILSVVPRSADMLLAANRGIPLLSQHKVRGPAAQALRAVVAAIVSERVTGAPAVTAAGVARHAALAR